MSNILRENLQNSQILNISHPATTELHTCLDRVRGEEKGAMGVCSKVRQNEKKKGW